MKNYADLGGCYSSRPILDLYKFFTSCSASFNNCELYNHKVKSTGHLHDNVLLFKSLKNKGSSLITQIMVVTLFRSSFRRRRTKVLGCGWLVTQPNDFLYRSYRMVSDRENERVFSLIYAPLSDLCFSFLLLFFSFGPSASKLFSTEWIYRATTHRLYWCSKSSQTAIILV